MKTFQIEIPVAICASLLARLAEFKSEAPGPNPGETIVRPVFPDVESWLRQIVGQNIAQLVPPETDPEVAQLSAAIEDLRRQHAAKANRVQVKSK
jgi:hypothetical protein